MMQRGAGDRSPTIELTIRPVITGFKRVRLKLCWTINDMPGVVDIPVSRENASFTHHAGVQLRPRIWRLNMKGCCGDSVINAPIYSAPKNVFIIIIHSKDKAAIDHDSERVQAIGNRFIIAAQVLSLVASLEVLRCECLKSDEDAAQPRLGGTLDQIAS